MSFLELIPALGRDRVSLAQPVCHGDRATGAAGSRATTTIGERDLRCGVAAGEARAVDLTLHGDGVAVGGDKGHTLGRGLSREVAVVARDALDGGERLGAPAVGVVCRLAGTCERRRERGDDDGDEHRDDRHHEEHLHEREAMTAANAIAIM